MAFSDGSWGVIPAPANDGMVLVSTKLEAGANRPVAWANVNGVTATDGNIAYTGFYSYPKGSQQISAGGFSWANNNVVTMTRKGNQVSTFSLSIMQASYVASGTGTPGVKYNISGVGQTITWTFPGLLPPDFRPTVKKTYAGLVTTTIYWLNPTEQSQSVANAVEKKTEIDIDGTVTWTHTIKALPPGGYSFYIKSFSDTVSIPAYDRTSTTPTLP